MRKLTYICTTGTAKVETADYEMMKNLRDSGWAIYTRLTNIQTDLTGKELSKKVVADRKKNAAVLA